MMSILGAILIVASTVAFVGEGPSHAERDQALQGPCLLKGSHGAEVLLKAPAPRERRDRPIDVLHYDLALELDPDTTKIAGTVLVRFRQLEVGTQLVLDFLSETDDSGRGMTVRSVLVEGAPGSFVHEGDSLSIDLGQAPSSADTLEVQVSFEGIPLFGGGPGFGLSRRFFYDDNFIPVRDQPVIASLSEPISARNWWPCHDHPYDAATVRLSVTAPERYTLAAPGVLEGDSMVPGGLRSQTYFMQYPIPSYLVSLVLADFEVWQDATTVEDLRDDGGIDEVDMSIQYFAPAVARAKAEYTWANTARMLATFEEWFGPYPYAQAKYGMALFIFGGAMEHPTVSSMGQSTVATTNSSTYGGPAGEWVVAHELAHQWFGDCVRVARWGEIWLNEAFARYSEVLWIEHEYGVDAARRWLNNIYRESYPGPIRDPSQLFGTTVYDKGGRVMHMLRKLMGKDEFLQAMRSYVMDPELRFGAVTTEDFAAHCTAVHGEDLSWFFEQWLDRSGRPSVTAKWGSSSGSLSLKFDQPSGDVFRLLLPVRVMSQSGAVVDTTVWVGAEGPSDEFVLEGFGDIRTVEFDPNTDLLVDLVVSGPGDLKAISLQGVYPNPFNPEVTVRFYLHGESVPTIHLYDVRGRSVAMRELGVLQSGLHDVQLDNKALGELSSGVYFVSVEANGEREVRKISMVR